MVLVCLFREAAILSYDLQRRLPKAQLSQDCVEETSRKLLSSPKYLRRRVRLAFYALVSTARHHSSRDGREMRSRSFKISRGSGLLTLNSIHPTEHHYSFSIETIEICGFARFKLIADQ